MKTLQKLTIIAFAVLSAGVANAQTQCVNCSPPTVRPPRPGRDPGCITCDGPGANSDRDRYVNATRTQPGPSFYGNVNSSTVYQRGTNQYACVDQIGGGNYATLIQDAGSEGSAGRNDAYQTQRNRLGFIDNQAYGLQTHTDNLLVQIQDGVGERARALQTGNRNIAAQFQGENGSYANSADVRQTTDDNVSVQYQLGHSNVSEVYQHRIDGNWAGTTQLGSNNTVSVNQH